MAISYVPIANSARKEHVENSLRKGAALKKGALLPRTRSTANGVV